MQEPFTQDENCLKTKKHQKKDLSKISTLLPLLLHCISSECWKGGEVVHETPSLISGVCEMIDETNFARLCFTKEDHTLLVSLIFPDNLLRSH